jgi:hypothetical protein
MWGIKPFVVFFVVIGIASISSAVIGWRMSSFYVNLNTQGITTTGMVTHDEIRQGSRWGSNHYYFYTYKDTAGATHSGNTAMSALTVGAPLEVTYLPNNPDHHVPFQMSSSRTYQPLRTALKFSFSLLCLTYAFGYIVFWFIRRSW